MPMLWLSVSHHYSGFDMHCYQTMMDVAGRVNMIIMSAPPVSTPNRWFGSEQSPLDATPGLEMRSRRIVSPLRTPATTFVPATPAPIKKKDEFIAR